MAKADWKGACWLGRETTFCMSYMHVWCPQFRMCTVKPAASSSWPFQNVFHVFSSFRGCDRTFCFTHKIMTVQCFSRESIPFKQVPRLFRCFRGLKTRQLRIELYKTSSKSFHIVFGNQKCCWVSQINFDLTDWVTVMQAYSCTCAAVYETCRGLSHYWILLLVFCFPVVWE